MTEHNQQSSQPISDSSNVTSTYYPDDEIDLSELLRFLWNGKWVIFTLAVVMAAVSTLYALKQPDIYKTQAKVELNSGSFYDSSLSPNYLIGSAFRNLIKQRVDKEGENQFSGIRFSYDQRIRVFTISKTSTSPANSFHGVELVLKSLNPILKELELEKVTTVINSTSTLGLLDLPELVKSKLSDMYAQELYKKAILESPSSQMIQVVDFPSQPTSPIKPKRLLIIAAGTLLGVLVGFIVILIRFASRKEPK